MPYCEQFADQQPGYGATRAPSCHMMCASITPGRMALALALALACTGNDETAVDG